MGMAWMAETIFWTRFWEALELIDFKFD